MTPAVGVVAGAVLFASGVFGLASPAAGDFGEIPAPSVTSTDEPLGVAEPPQVTSRPVQAIPAGPRRTAAFTPRRIEIPRIGLDATVVPVAVGRDRLLNVPEDVRRVGWWQGGAPAGSRYGTVVLVAHVDSAEQGAGAFFNARKLTRGDRIVVSAAGDQAGGEAEYVVVARRQYAKSDLPAAQVFGQGTLPRLVLVTCGGNFDRATRSYEDNVVVFAEPA